MLSKVVDHKISAQNLVFRSSTTSTCFYLIETLSPPQMPYGTLDYKWPLHHILYNRSVTSVVRFSSSCTYAVKVTPLSKREHG